jgi:RNA polymerase sigma-B factor
MTVHLPRHARATPETLTRRWIEDARAARRHRSGDPRAREVLIVRYLPLAHRLALRYRRANEPVDDLVQVASLGLVKAVDRWDPDRGFTFATFAIPTILGELRRYFRDSTWTVRPTRGLLDVLPVIEQAREALSATTGREPTVTELAEHLGRSPLLVAEALLAAEGRQSQSLERPVHDDDLGQTTLAELLGGDDEGYEQADARATAERLTRVLDHRAREVLRLRFDDDLKQSEIGARVGCTQMHVSRILRASLETLHIEASGAPA